MPGLSFVTLLAYDYRYSFQAIRSYYDIADEIILGLDRDRLTWSRQPFPIDLQAVHAFIASVDREKKIRIVEDKFHTADHPMQNEIQERSALSLHCAAGNWIVQIDADEFLMNGPEFKEWMQTARDDDCVSARWITVYKTFGNQVLVIDPPTEIVPIATKLRGQYIDGRATKKDYQLSPLFLLHFSWGRKRDELALKLRNWGHAREFDADSFLRQWDSVTLENYRQFHNFRFKDGKQWERLRLVNLDSRRIKVADFESPV